MTGDMNIKSNSTGGVGFLHGIQKKLELMQKKEAILFEATKLSNKYKAEANIIADFLYSQGGKDGKISADVWNNSDYADGRTNAISIEDAVEAIFDKLQKDAEEAYILKQQKELTRLELEQTQRLAEEDIKSAPPKFGE